MKVLFATTNPHKAREMAQLLAPFGIEVRGLSPAAARGPEPAEDGLTLEENARIKACHYARAEQAPCLADDSGLEVEALEGAPGVRSARYAGLGASREERDAENRKKLVHELRVRGAVTRAARLSCTLCFADAAGHVLFETRGSCEAAIIDEPRGGSGFGYDSLLYLPELGKTAAELTPEEWGPRSHRGQAARQFAAWCDKNRAQLSE